MKYTEHILHSADGTPIGYKMLGTGPGLLVIHGGFRSSVHYLRMAELLSSSFTMYIIDRRGRNSSGPRGTDYSLEKECADAITLLKAHEISFAFGHSFGGLVALNVAAQHPLKKVAVYEPAISINHSVPAHWLQRFEKELAQNDPVSALVTMTQGLQMAGPLNHVPKFLLRPLFRLLSKKNPDWQANSRLLGLVPGEMDVVQKMDGQLERYRKITASVLLLSGAKSPAFLRNVLPELEKYLLHSVNREIVGVGHNAPDEETPEKIAAVLQDFFAGKGLGK